MLFCLYKNCICKVRKLNRGAQSILIIPFLINFVVSQNNMCPFNGSKRTFCVINDQLKSKINLICYYAVMALKLPNFNSL